MIIIGFIVDYFIMLLFPFNSYALVYDLDKNKIFDVIVVGMLFSVMYGKILFFFFVLGLYFVLRRMKVKNKYFFIKNILLYFVFFNISFLMFGFRLNRCFFLFGMGFVMFLAYMFLNKVYK